MPRLGLQGWGRLPAKKARMAVWEREQGAQREGRVHREEGVQRCPGAMVKDLQGGMVKPGRPEGSQRGAGRTESAFMGHEVRLARPKCSGALLMNLKGGGSAMRPAPETCHRAGRWGGALLTASQWPPTLWAHVSTSYTRADQGTSSCLSEPLSAQRRVNAVPERLPLSVHACRQRVRTEVGTPWCCRGIGATNTQIPRRCPPVPRALSRGAQPQFCRPSPSWSGPPMTVPAPPPVLDR